MSANGKVAIVTGAGTGIGKATALAFLEDGYKVAFAGRRPDVLENAIKEAGDRACFAIAVSTDISDPAAVKNLFSKTRDKFGRIDVVFNNAGFGASGATEDLTFEQWKSVVDVNLTDTFLCIQEAFRTMKSQNPMGGRIINNGSVAAHVPRPNSIAYTATKHGIIGLTKSASLDGRKYDIACSQIDIGNALTKPLSNGSTGNKQVDTSTKKMEPMMNVRDVASAVLYMASLPLDTNIQFMTIMATKMPYIGRG